MDEISNAAAGAAERAQQVATATVAAASDAAAVGSAAGAARMHRLSNTQAMDYQVSAVAFRVMSAWGCGGPHAIACTFCKLSQLGRPRELLLQSATANTSQRVQRRPHAARRHPGSSATTQSGRQETPPMRDAPAPSPRA
jgi:hypothetical protein